MPVFGNRAFQIAAGLPFTASTLWFTRVTQNERAEGRATMHRLGDLRLRPQIGLLPDKKPVALAVEVKIPAYSVDSICADTPQFAIVCPRPGDGQIDITPTVLAGGGVGKRGFAEVSLGYMYRSDWFVGWDTPTTFSDSIVFSAGGGYPHKKALFMLKLDGNLWPVDDGITQQAVRLGPAMLLDIKQGLALEARTQVDLYARHAAQGLGFGLGLSARK